MPANKRPRLAGEFNPISQDNSSSITSTTSPTSPTSLSLQMNGTQSDTIMSDEPESGISIKREDDVADYSTAAQSVEPPIPASSNDVEMSEALESQSQRLETWRLAESTAHPASIARYINSDRGPAYMLRSTNPVHGNPHPSRQNLVSLFGLNSIATSVRRVDPSTGEKINKLRKSYEGKIKELKIAGRNKAVSNLGEFASRMMEIPEDDWKGTKVYGKEMTIAASESFQLKLKRSLDGVVTGSLPQGEVVRWKGVLGVDEVVAPGTVSAGGKPTMKARTIPTVNSSVDGIISTSGVHASASGISQNQVSTSGVSTSAGGTERPGRTGKKRKYTDDSFAGYNDAFGADELDGADHDLDLDEESAKRKRKKINQVEVY